MACAINLGSSVIITGGGYYGSPNKVSEYNENGWVSDLPDLLQGRAHHGCTYYDNDEGTKVEIDVENYCPLIIFQTYLVSGGWTGSDELSSTELLVETASAWVNTGELPSPRWGLRGANIDNRILMTGN